MLSMMAAGMRLFAVLFLALALLASWQAALQHPIEHVDEFGEFVHAHSDHSHEEDSDAGPLCDALAALTACAPEAAQPALASEQPQFSVPLRHEGVPRVAEAPPFLSQGPPAFV